METLMLMLKQDMINGFSYSFTKALLKKLKSLDEKDLIFSEGKEIAKKDDVPNLALDLTNIAAVIVAYLKGQMRADGAIADKWNLNPSGVASLIRDTEEFLAIFEKKE